MNNYEQIKKLILDNEIPKFTEGEKNDEGKIDLIEEEEINLFYFKIEELKIEGRIVIFVNKNKNNKDEFTIHWFLRKFIDGTTLFSQKEGYEEDYDEYGNSFFWFDGDYGSHKDLINADSELNHNHKNENLSIADSLKYIKYLLKIMSDKLLNESSKKLENESMNWWFKKMKKW